MMRMDISHPAADLSLPKAEWMVLEGEIQLFELRALENVPGRVPLGGWISSQV